MLGNVRRQCLGGLGVLLFAAHAATAAPVLPATVDAALKRAHVPRDALVVVVQEIDARSPRLAWRPKEAVNPASLFKLVTTDAALELLGPAWRWNTPVWLQGAVHGGVLEGNLVIQGRGDPKLVLEQVWLLLRRVQQLGVTEIRGDIVLDRSAFSVPMEDPAQFDGEALRPYNVRPDALLLNFRSVLFTFTPDATAGVARIAAEPALAGVATDTQVPLSVLPCNDWRGALMSDFSDPARQRFGGHFARACGEKQWPVAPAEPERYNERMLLALWRDMGGRISGTVRDGVAPTDPPTFELSSPPLADVVRDINKFSNNVMAQQLFFTLALTQHGQGTPEAGRAVLSQWLSQRFGTPGAAAVVDNGSGLSRDTRVSAELLAKLLQAAWASPVMPELMSSLPVVGVDGTLQRSLVAPGRAHLKTGSLRDVAGLAGYVLSNRGRRYVLVAIINHPNANAARPALEALVQWAADGAPH